MNLEDIDLVRLRNDLINYFGSAVYIIPYAKYEMLEAQTCNDVDLVNMAIRNNFNLNNYLDEKRH